MKSLADCHGDKGVGTNHVLPTSRAARFTGDLWVGKFLKTCTWQQLTAEGTRAVAPAIEAICVAEHMLGHGLTATMRRARSSTTACPWAASPRRRTSPTRSATWQAPLPGASGHSLRVDGGWTAW